MKFEISKFLATSTNIIIGVIVICYKKKVFLLA